MLRIVMALALLWPLVASANFGLVGSTGTDQTIEAIYQLRHFQRYPNYPQFYFSDGDADVVSLPAGVDTNPCTKYLPCRTIDKMEQVLQRGQVHVILDSNDDWNLAADWTAGGGDHSVVILHPSSCSGIGSDQPCFVISATSFSPSNRARIDCTLAPAGVDQQSLFGLEMERQTHGWGAIENIEFFNCPADPTVELDILRTRNDDPGGSSSSWVSLNLKSVDGVRGVPVGNRNEFLSGAVSRGVHVGLNLEAFVANVGVGYAGSLLDFSSGSAILIGRSELYSADADASATLVLGSDGTTPLSSYTTDFVLIGHTLTNRSGVAASVGIDWYWRSIPLGFLLADLTVSGFTGATDIGARLRSSSVGTYVSVTGKLFRTTFRDNTTHFATLSTADETVSIDGSCLLFDGHGAADFTFTNPFHLGTEAQTLNFRGLYDDDPAGDHYTVNVTNYATALLATAAGAPQLSLFQSNSVESGGVGVDGNAFGTLTNHLACNNADCLSQCAASERATYSFRNDGIPPLVLGTKVTGLNLGGTYRNFGGR